MTSTEHDQWIVDEIEAGRYALDWHRLDLGPFAIELTCDALVLTGPGIRPSPTPAGAQRIADAIGRIEGRPCALPTPLISQWRWIKADARLHPHTQAEHKPGGTHLCPDCGKPTDSFWNRCQPCGERAHSAAIDAEIAALSVLGRLPTDRPALFACIGKPWHITAGILAHPELPGQPFGWGVPEAELKVGHNGKLTWSGIPVSLMDFGPGPWGERYAHLLQGYRGKGEEAPHAGVQSDYGEPLVLVRGVDRHIATIYRSPTLSRLVSHEGPLNDWRLPGVPLA